MAWKPPAQPVTAATEGLWSPICPVWQLPVPGKNLRYTGASQSGPGCFMVRQTRCVWKGEQICNFKKIYKCTFSSAKTTEYLYCNCSVFPPCQNRNFQEVHQSWEEKYWSPVFALWLLYLLYHAAYLTSLISQVFLPLLVKWPFLRTSFQQMYLDICPSHCFPDFPLAFLSFHSNTSQLSGCCFEFQGVTNLPRTSEVKLTL